MLVEAEAALALPAAIRVLRITRFHRMLVQDAWWFIFSLSRVAH